MSPLCIPLALGFALSVSAALPPQQCMASAGSIDCRKDNQFVCTAAFDEFVKGAVFGYCNATTGPQGSSPWQCCLNPLDVVPSKAPPRTASYPLPSSKRVEKPNVVFVLTDDQDFRLGSLDAMNVTKELYGRGGTMLENFRVVLPICCPSRISILSGRYPHNSGARSDQPQGWCSIGDYWKGPGQNVSLPTYIKAAGYRTGIFGKELNVNDDTYISPGWDRFFVLGGSSEGHYYSDWYNDQGQRYTAKQNEYMTALISNRSRVFIQEALEDKKPFFAYIAPHAPHTRATPAVGTDGYFVGRNAPRSPNWNASAPNHHWMVRQQAPMSERCALASDELFRNRLKALLGVDRMIQSVADLIQSYGQLDNTYFIYTADHGFHLGQFRMPYFKGQPYETDLRVPFLIRGPGIAPGRTIPAFGAMIDVAPTIADLVGATVPERAQLDGRSMVPLLFGDADAVEWRKELLFEFYAGGKQGGPCAIGPYCRHIMMSPNNTYSGVVTTEGWKYIEFRDDEKFLELFDLNQDPWEITNLAYKPEYAQRRTELAERLNILRNCSMGACWST